MTQSQLKLDDGLYDVVESGQPYNGTLGIQCFQLREATFVAYS